MIMGSRTAIQRCSEACRSMAADVAAIVQTDLVSMNPQLVPCLFVGARFCLGGYSLLRYRSTTDGALSVGGTLHSPDLSTEFNALLRAMDVCGTRWHFSRMSPAIFSCPFVFKAPLTITYTGRLAKVLHEANTGQAEHRTLSPLPPELFDLRYSALDIDESLRVWAGNVDEK